MEEFNVADELLSNSANRLTSSDFNIADELLTPMPHQPVAGPVRHTGQISTITNKPITEYDPEAPGQASFGAMTQAAMVKQPETKMKVFAESRGIPVENYSVDASGEIIFKDDYGNWHYEEKSPVGTDKLKRVSANIAGSPAITGATVGLVASGGNPFGAVTGGLLAETARQAYAGIVLDDPQTAKGNLASLGKEGLLAYLTEVGSRLPIALFNKALGIGKESGRSLRAAAGLDYHHINKPEAVRIKELGKEFGIDLFPAQTTKSQQLIAKMNLLRDLPQTSDVIKAADALQQEQIQAAIPAFMDLVSPRTTVSKDVGKGLQKVADRAVKGLSADRANITKTFYKAALKENPDVPVDDILKYIDNKLVDAKAAERKALMSLRDDVYKPFSPTEKPKLYGPDNKPIVIPDEPVTSSLRGMHSLKTSLDKRLKSLGNSQDSIDKLISNEIKTVKNMALDAMSSASPAYDHGRTMHKILSSSVDEGAESVIGTLAKGKGDQMTKLSSVLLASSYTKPETVAAAKKLILKQQGGEDIWNQAVRDYMEHVFDNIATSQVSDVTNLGGQFQKKLFGNRRQRLILKEALGDKFTNLENFMTVLKRTGLTFGRESTTATRQKMLKDAERNYASKIARAVTGPVSAARDILDSKVNDLLFERGMKDVAATLLDDAAEAELIALKQLTPGSEALLKGFSEFLQLSAVKEGERKLLR